MKVRYNKGFTLIEMMIVIAIVSILAMIVIPGYQAQIRKAHRAAIQADMVSFARAIEKAATLRFSFTGLAADGDTGAPLPNVFDAQGPLTNEVKLYDFTIINSTASTYQISAVPRVGTVMEGDGRFTLNHLNDRCFFNGHDKAGGECVEW